MSRSLLILAAIGGLGLAAERVSAQQPYAPSPAVSPYINLLRRGSDPAINYFGIVRPIVDQQAFNQQVFTGQQQMAGQLQQLQDQTSQYEASPESPHLAITGHSTQLMSQNRYFQTRGTGSLGAPTGTTGVRPTVAPRPGPAPTGTSSIRPTTPSPFGTSTGIR